MAAHLHKVHEGRICEENTGGCVFFSKAGQYDVFFFFYYSHVSAVMTFLLSGYVFPDSLFRQNRKIYVFKFIRSCSNVISANK